MEYRLLGPLEASVDGASVALGPTEDRHRPGDPNSCALEPLAPIFRLKSPPMSCHVPAGDLIEQLGDRGVIGARPWPERSGQWWTWCQSLGPSSRRFAGSIPSASPSMVLVTAQQNTGVYVKAAVPAAGSFTIYLTGNAPGQD